MWRSRLWLRRHRGHFLQDSTLIDEIGYRPVSQDGAVLFFQLINARHERASTVLTSNKGFEEWGHVLGDEVMAAALIDRLLHHCHIINIRGNSYRIREHQHWLQSASEQRREGALYSDNQDENLATIRMRESPPLALGGRQ